MFKFTLDLDPDPPLSKIMDLDPDPPKVMQILTPGKDKGLREGKQK